jgi:hypothetical protein
MTIIMKDIKKITERLERLKPAKSNMDSDRSLSTKEAIELLAPKLRKMKAQGFTLAELVTALAEDGLIIKPNTLGCYLSQSKSGDSTQAVKEKKKKRSARPLASDAPESDGPSDEPSSPPPDDPAVA